MNDTLMEQTETLIIGAGMSGLATAAALSDRGHSDFIVLEADREIGGYCKTIKRDGFVWDYSGHFFHFKHPEIEQYLRERMSEQRVRSVTRRSFIDYQGRRIDFPFQKNIHQLPQQELIDCLYLVRNGVPFDIAFSLPPDERLAFVVALGSLDGVPVNKCDGASW